MSSFKCRRNRGAQSCNQAQSFKDVHGSKCKQQKGLLRLDSTGEVASDHKNSNCRSPLMRNHGLNNKDLEDKNCYKTLKMDSILNSASAYIVSATSYIGSLYPCTSSKRLTRTRKHSDSSSFEHLQNILSGEKVSDMEKQIFPTIEPGINNGCPSCKYTGQTKVNTQLDKSVKWTGNIFGAIQCSLLGNCSTNLNKMKHPNVERYVPPQRRYRQYKTTGESSTVDPKLTPYNAKLLEKSKKLQSERNVKSKEELDSYPSELNVHTNVWKNRKLNDHDNKADCDRNKTVQKNVLDEMNDTVTSTERIGHCQKTRHGQISTEIEAKSHSPDWFDYVCETAKCIPTSLERSQHVPTECANNDDDFTRRSDTRIQQLHNWFSENSNDVAPSVDLDPVCDESSVATNCSSSICDKTVSSLQNKDLEKSGMSDAVHEVSNISEGIIVQQENDVERLSSSCQPKPQNELPVTDDDHVSVLYIRSLSKKSRPSAKKRRRHKAQQNENGETSKASSDKVIPALKPGSAIRSSSSIAFILGYDQGSSKNSIHSFHMSCGDINSDSEWTESDCDSDDNFSSLEDESNLASELAFQCNDPLNSTLFTLTCTRLPTNQSLVPPKISAIDDINMSWRVQVSLELETQKKKSSTSKKVHFAEKNLAIVHPIIAWSYAYQAARKGPWEQYARDRGRFLRRITDGESLLTSVLNTIHRDRIFQERWTVRN